MRLVVLLSALLAASALTGCELAFPTHESEPESDAATDTSVLVPGKCKPPGYYCGNDKVPGDPTILYQCVDGADARVHERCEAGCTIAPSGVDDFCSR